MNDRRIVLLGKTGDGKSSTGNTILGVETFLTDSSPESVTRRCESRTTSINERKITVVDGPGFFDTSLPEKELNGEILRCITECAPGPHAFLIVLRVGKYTEQEKEVVKKITASFGEDALRYAVVLFTHGDQLSKKQSIQDFVEKSAALQGLVDKCGGRVHVIDNNNKYRSKRVQVQKLLKTIEEMVKNNRGQCYTNEMLQKVQKEIEEEMKKSEIDRNKLVRLVGLGTGTLVGALLGGKSAVKFFSKNWDTLSDAMIGEVANLLGATSGAAEVSKSLTKSVKLKAVGVAASAVLSGVAGGIIGYNAAEGAETVTEAIKRAASATYDSAEDVGQIINKKKCRII